VTLSRTEGTVDKAVRIEVGVRWDAVPAAAAPAHVAIAGPDGRVVTVEVPVLHADARTAGVTGFVESGGAVAIEAEHHARAFAPAGRTWLRVPGLGRTLSGMTTLPSNAPPLSAADAMRLEYDVWLFDAGKVKLQTTLAPTLKFRPEQGLRYAVSIDDEAPQVVDIHADASMRHWERIVSDGVAQFTTDHVVARPGRHVLKFWAIDPGVVLQRVVLDAGGVRPSYLGPVESRRLP